MENKSKADKISAGTGDDFFRNCIENCSDLILVVDSEGLVSYVGSSVERLLGYKPEEIEGTDGYWLIHPDDQAVAMKASMEAYTLPGTPNQVIEIRYRHKNGSWRYHETIGTCFVDKAGNRYLVINARDVTERKEIETTLKESERRLRMYLENTFDLILIIGAKFKNYVYISPSVEKLLGYKTEEAMLLKPADWIHPDDLSYTISVSKGSHDQPGSGGVITETRYRHKNGSWRYFELVGKSFKDEQEPDIYNVVIARDVTERKMMEETLRKSEEQYRLLAENSNDVIWTMELPSCKTVYVSPSVERLLGYTPEEFLNMKTGAMLSTSSAVEQNLANTIAALSDGNGSQYFRQEGEHICKDGKKLWLESNIKVLYDKSGVATGLQGTSRDISERKQLEKDIIHSNAELEQFAYIASHDLREPLRMITSYIDLLKKRYSPRFDDDANDFMTFIVDAAYRMKQLINDLLSYSRVGTKRKPPETTDSQAVLDKTLLSLKMVIEENNAAVTNDPLPTVMADTVQLGQLFQNLISNAIKFHGEEPPKVHISVEQQNNEWVFSIRDNGIGIEPQYFDRIFMIYQRLHKREQYSGTGIGLAVCKKIVENMGGRIWVESEVGKGTTFFFTVPR